MEFEKSLGTNHSHNGVPDQLNVLEDRSTFKAPPTLLERLEAQIVQHKSNLATPFSVEQIQQALQNEMWEVRSTAIERLSTKDNAEGFALLAQAFHDEHRFVRMAALRTLAQKGDTSISRSMFVRGLHDDDWQVREVAIQVLGLLGTPACLELVKTVLHDENTEVRDAAQLAIRQYEGYQAPSTQIGTENQSLLQTEVLQMALHDSDASVRNAAGLIPQWNSTHEETPVMYGYLWEEKAMQDQSYDMKRSKHNDGTSVSDTPLTASSHGNSYGSYGVQEQMQGYAAREYTARDHFSQETAPSDEYADPISSSREKITSYRLRSKPRKRWWALVAAIAVLFFMLGHFTTLLVPQSGLPVSNTTSHVYIPPSYKNSPNTLSTMEDAVIIQEELAAGLHLPANQLIKQLHQHGSLAALAVAQGVSETQLKSLEFSTAQDAFNTTFEPYVVNSPQGIAFIERLYSDQAFLITVLDNALAVCRNDYCVGV